MIFHLFPTQVAVTQLAYGDDFLQRLEDICLRVDAQHNPAGKPWTRADHDIYDEPDPELAKLHADIVQYAQAAYGVEVDAMIGRDMILNDRDLIPPHSDRDSHLSAIFYLRTPARADLQAQDYNGCFFLQDPSRYYDARQMPWENAATFHIPARRGMLVLFPSHLCHFTHTLNAPGDKQIEIHHEIKVRHVHNKNVKQTFLTSPDAFDRLAGYDQGSQ